MFSNFWDIFLSSSGVGTITCHRLPVNNHRKPSLINQTKGSVWCIYKDEDAPVEDTQVPEDSQDKELESKLETALEALKRYKHTLNVPLRDSLTPTDEQ